MSFVKPKKAALSSFYFPVSKYMDAYATKRNITTLWMPFRQKLASVGHRGKDDLFLALDKNGAFYKRIFCREI